jgi:copper homeostasis protein (lipoprotein)
MSAVVALIAAFMMSSSGSILQDPGKQKPLPLRGTAWALTHLGGKPIDLKTAGKPPTLRLETTQNYSGFGGCNQFKGTYSTKESSLTFGPAVMTRMWCPALQSIETPFSAALDQTRSWRITEKSLELLDGKGEVVAKFEAQPPKSGADKMP